MRNCVSILKKKNNKKRVLSLFSGCGGMDLGFEGCFKVPIPCVNEKIHPDWIYEKDEKFIKLQPTSFNMVFANDILNFAQTAWCSYFKKFGYKDDLFHLESIVDLVKKYKNGEYAFPKNIDVVTGGFPCQDFSIAGKRRGFNSEKSHNGKKEIYDIPTTETRGMLYLWMKEVIEITKPKVFIAENVKGLVSFGDVKNIIENDFRNIDSGYLVVPARVLFAGDYGIPQKRERVIFIGFNKKYLKKEALKALSMENIQEEYDPYPVKTHFDDSKNIQLNFIKDVSKLKPYVRTYQVLQDLKEPNLEKLDLAQMSYSKAKYCPNSQGQTEINLTGLAPTIRAEHHGNIEYRRLSKENGGKHIKELDIGLKERRLTVRECARFQTFPDDYHFVQAAEKKGHYNLSASNAYKLVGNAVPPLLAYNIAKRLEEIWDKIFIQ
ncbi:MAG: DNA (cytosine-5-)-methyltransferase [Candidatus Gastranaerophilales bacterium]|nr:DNA (cytosine-5-)-methyltransferase [Candidatus Gastranaerophilales bacterium]